MAFIWRDRVVEVWTSAKRVGTAIAVGPESALTARHIIADSLYLGDIYARVVRPGERVGNWVLMQLVWEDEGWDLALITVAPQATRSDWLQPASNLRIVRLGTHAELHCE